MINLHWFELPMALTIFHGPKDVRAIEVRLYSVINKNIYHLFSSAAVAHRVLKHYPLVRAAKKIPLQKV